MIRAISPERANRAIAMDLSRKHADKNSTIGADVGSPSHPRGVTVAINLQPPSSPPVAADLPPGGGETIDVAEHAPHTISRTESDQ
jgi:hypothetical protein